MVFFCVCVLAITMAVYSILHRGSGNNCKRTYGLYNQIFKTVEMLENAGLLDAATKDQLRSQWTNDNDAWVLMVDKANGNFQFVIDNISM